MTVIDPRLQRLVDRDDIRDVVTRYFVATDRRDFAAFVDCFVPGTAVDYSELLPVEPGCPIEQVAAVIEATMAGLYGPTQHFMGNHVCTVDGDVAHAETYCLALHEYLDAGRDGGQRPASALRYVDRLVRGTDGRWRIEHRRVTRDLAMFLAPRSVPPVR